VSQLYMLNEKLYKYIYVKLEYFNYVIIDISNYKRFYTYIYRVSYFKSNYKQILSETFLSTRFSF